MTRMNPQSPAMRIGICLGWVSSLVGAIGGVVALATSHLGLILFTLTHIFASQQENVDHAVGDAAFVYIVFFWGGLLLVAVSLGFLTLGILLLQKYSDKTDFDRDSVRRDVLNAGGIVLILGPSLAGVAGIFAFGLNAILPSLLFATVVFCIGLALIFRGVRPAIHPDQPPA